MLRRPASDEAYGTRAIRARDRDAGVLPGQRAGHARIRQPRRGADHGLAEAVAAEFPVPRELLGMILGGGGQAVGVEHAALFDVIRRG